MNKRKTLHGSLSIKGNKRNIKDNEDLNIELETK